MSVDDRTIVSETELATQRLTDTLDTVTDRTSLLAGFVQRTSRFYDVAYDGIDPLTGREHRRWHPAEHSRTDAEAIAANLDAAHTALETPVGADSLTVARYLTEKWLPVRRHDLDPSTAHSYGWMIDHYITPAVGHLRLRSLRTEHLDRLYTDLLTIGGTRGAPASPQRPCTTSTWFAAPRSTTPSTPT